MGHSRLRAQSRGKGPSQSNPTGPDSEAPKPTKNPKRPPRRSQETPNEIPRRRLFVLGLRGFHLGLEGLLEEHVLFSEGFDSHARSQQARLNILRVWGLGEEGSSDSSSALCV